MSKKKTPEIEILYEDKDCLVINKPAGIMVHADGRSEGPFLTDWVVKNYPKTKNVGEPIRTPEGETVVRPGIVHRLDKETSGALIIAKTAKAHAFIKKQFQDRTVHKKYLAFVWGELLEEFGTIKRDIGRSSTDFRKWSSQRGIRGEAREAETYWTRIGTGKADDAEGKLQKFTLIEAEPKTGRTHQIRVHFLAIQHPVVADSLYAETKPKALGFERLALHSSSIEFEGLNGKPIKVTAPLPDDFIHACNELGVGIPRIKK
jgi:23S rRNA pseudouridine1911/1915/1917 synthase